MREYRVVTSVDENGGVHIRVDQRDGGPKWGQWKSASSGWPNRNNITSTTLYPPSGGRRRQAFFEWRVRRTVKKANTDVEWLKAQDALRADKTKMAREALAKAGIES